MDNLYTATVLPLLAALLLDDPPVIPHLGLVIRSSCHVASGAFLLPTNEGAKRAGDETIPTLAPAITIRGDGITVDLTGVILRGSPAAVMPDERRGLGILVEGKNITIKNVHIHGYRVALMARHADGLRILNSDFSYNWKQHLRSTVEREDASDWQSYHHNEHDEWLRYGAALSLWDCNGFEVRGTKAEGGQCGLMLTRCDNGLVWNDDFSFMSGLGIGMYRSSGNRIMHNRIDWDVRGFSYGVYNRGQDSAGILVFEQCNHNLFAYNSVTHGGDGFFLWAGQQTMDTGRGGCNDNLILSNDFSGAATNGMEATFSRNRFLNNLAQRCWHGLWNGYSYDSEITGNYFAQTEIGIATEHGQNNRMRQNSFVGNKTAVQLWADKIQDPSWGYGKTRDTRSSGNVVNDNRFEGNPTVLSVHNSPKTSFVMNVIEKSKTALSADVMPPFSRSDLDYNSNLFGEDAAIPPGLNEAEEHRVIKVMPLVRAWNPWDLDWLRTGELIPPLKDGQHPFLKPGTLRGWPYILVDDWGPYDFKRPLLWPREEIRPGRKRFEILGPKGRWHAVYIQGVSRISAKEGSVPGFIDVDFPGAQAVQTKINLVYIGAATTDARGISTPAGRSVPFGYSRFFAPIAWDVKFFRWKQSENAADPHAAPKDFPSVLATAPIKEVNTDRLDMAGSALVAGLPNDHYATLAEGTFTVAAGNYSFDLTTDDGARVWLDGKPLIEDAWHYQGPTTYTRKAHLTAGQHKLRIEHFQIDGFAELKLELGLAK